MHQISLRVPLLASVSLGTLLTATTAQAVVAKQAAGAPGSAAAAAAKDDAALEGLPRMLLLVPGGNVEMGLEGQALLQAAMQVVWPSKPEMALKTSEKQVGDAMRRSASVLGPRRVQVETFLLAKWPVKCAEYEPFVAAQRAAGHKARPPFGWWRYGRKDHYEQHLPEINKAFPRDPAGPVLYWERYGHDFPYKLEDEKGNSIAEHPVTFVSWREANEFAARIGMRLPTEAEWTRAARGDGEHVWPLADPADPATDRYVEQLLHELRLFQTRDRVVKPVGSVQAAVGPFGHVDMFGQVWQLVGDLGYWPINGTEPFAAEWKRLQQHKVASSLLTSHPSWDDNKVVAKGGSYLSAGEPIQLMIDARAPMLTIDVLESVGVRLAKSLKPGYDLMYSSLRAGYHKGPFLPEQRTLIEGQVGAERYQLAPDGFPQAYHAVSFAPVNWIAAEKNVELGKQVERSQTSPMLIGTLVTTDRLAVPEAPPGIYSVLYRKAGVPRELTDAIKQGHKELATVARNKKSGDEADDGKDDAKKDDKKDDKKDKKGSWREVIARFGLTEADLAVKEAADGTLPFVRIDALEIPIADDVFLLHGNDGKLVAVWPVPNAKPAAGPPFPSALVVEADAKGRAVAKFHVGVPLSAASDRRVAGVHLHVVLDQPAPSPEQPWRLPAAPK